MSNAFDLDGGAPVGAVVDLVSAELGIPRQEISPDSSLADDLGLDRWDLYELLERLEEVYEVRVPDAVVDRVESVSELAEALEAAASRKA